jgi:hypothetical protein
MSLFAAHRPPPGRLRDVLCVFETLLPATGVPLAYAERLFLQALPLLVEHSILHDAGRAAIEFLGAAPVHAPWVGRHGTGAYNVLTATLPATSDNRAALAAVIGTVARASRWRAPVRFNVFVASGDARKKFIGVLGTTCDAEPLKMTAFADGRTLVHRQCPADNFHRRLVTELVCEVRVTAVETLRDARDIPAADWNMVDELDCLPRVQRNPDAVDVFLRHTTVHERDTVTTYTGTAVDAAESRLLAQKRNVLWLHE